MWNETRYNFLVLQKRKPVNNHLDTTAEKSNYPSKDAAHKTKAKSALFL